MLHERGVVKLGFEIEVARFKTGESYATTAKELVGQGYMWGEPAQWEEVHEYHCSCDLGCRYVRQGASIYPPLVSMTYDASLPTTGAEFITSTFVLTNDSLDDFKPVWDTITSRAVWDNTQPNRRDTGLASPSVHIHVSAHRVEQPQNGDMLTQSYDDILHALSLFAPELIAVASSAGIQRGLIFRQPIRRPTDTPHHGFVQIKQVNDPVNSIYIEWRMFEAAYEDWEYIEACAFLAATLTRAFLRTSTIPYLMRTGYANPPDYDKLYAAILKDNTDEALNNVSEERLDALRTICLDELDDDAYGQKLLMQLFQKTATLILGRR